MTQRTTKKQKFLAQLIADMKFDWVNENITEENFPPQPIRGDYKLFHFDAPLSSEDIIKKMQEKGYVPANIYELLSNDWNGKDCIVALGSITKVRGLRYVPCLGRLDAGRFLSLGWRDDDWDGFCRFLAVRASSGSSDLKPLDPPTLPETLIVNGYVYKRTMK